MDHARHKLLSNTLLSHYRIIAELGAGAMGEVYLAEDVRLKRRVAIKVLPASVTTDTERVRRFEQEAQAASALNHPNIITVYDIGESESGRFLVMELVAGRTLRELIGSDVPPETVLSVGHQMAKALSTAHAAGIMHRDIKPENVMVRDDGYVKVLDFGLALLLAAETEHVDSVVRSRLTTPGMIIGTVAYMSPEQAFGEAVGPASDVFALGLVLYELATGRHPFDAATTIALLHAIATQDPTPAHQAAPRVPLALSNLLARMLEKDASARPSATDVAHALQAIERGSDPARALAVTPATTPHRAVHSIAVLPFANISADAENEYFCDGLAEELLNGLAKIDALKVAARGSAFSFKGRNTEARAIGQTLNVDTVLEGSVRKSGQRLRISVQLVNVADGYQLWSERYDREMVDIFDVQDEISLAVVDALKVKLFGDEQQKLVDRYTRNTDAYELFLKGRFHAYKYTAAGWKRAIDFFEQAVAIEPDYALAYAGLTTSRGCLWFFGILPAEEVIPQAKADYRRALALDSDLAEAHLSAAMIMFFYDWNWNGAEQSFARSLSLDPKNAEALSYYAMLLGFLGRFGEAAVQNAEALALDPLSPLINMNVGWNYFAAGDSIEAARLADKLIEMESEFFGAYWLKGVIDLTEGNFDSAIEHLQRAVTLGGHQIVVADLASACSLAGRDDDAARILGELLAKRERDYVPAICLARVYSRTGEHEKAVEWIERAFEERNGEMVFLKAEIDGAADGDVLRALADDPRVMDVLRRMNLPEEHNHN